MNIFYQLNKKQIIANLKKKAIGGKTDVQLCDFCQTSDKTRRYRYTASANVVWVEKGMVIKPILFNIQVNIDRINTKTRKIVEKGNFFEESAL